MEQILQISTQEANFLQHPINQAHSVLCNELNVEFKFDLYVPVFMKILEIDFNLSRMHAKLIPKMKNEELFWYNYYLRLLYLRCVVGIDLSEEERQLNELLLDQTEVNSNILQKRDRLTALIRLRKQIARLNREDVLFTDYVAPAPTPTPAATAVVSSSVTSANMDGCDPATVTAAGGHRAVTTSATNSSINNSTSSADKSLLTSQAVLHIKKQLLDKELEDEVGLYICICMYISVLVWSNSNMCLVMYVNMA